MRIALPRNIQSSFSQAFRLGFILAVFPLFAHASGTILISEGDAERVRIELRGDALASSCAAKNGQVFAPATQVAKISENLYSQTLDSIVSEEANYLKAARMGGGIYMHLPYFVPAGPCKDVEFEVNARHIQWNGKWYAESVRIPARSVREKSVFFTNEEKPRTTGSIYFDASIPDPIQAGLTSDFSRVVAFYTDVLEARPLDNVGVVVAIVRNKGGYSGFGGDSLNIIRMSYDNPTPKELATIGKVFPATFTHELAHKLQSERLFANPMGRQIVEGSADFLAVLVLRSSGLISEEEAKVRIRKAASDCAAFADTRPMREKVSSNAVNYREPYDCGMVYYFVSYLSSGLSGDAYVQTLRKSLSAQANYSERTDTLCMLFEADCRNERLKGVMGNKEQFVQQVDWLAGQLSTQQLPVIGGKLTNTVKSKAAELGRDSGAEREELAVIPR